MSFLPVTDVNTKHQDGYQLDAFRRLRVAQPYTLFESQMHYNDQPMLWETIIEGNASKTYMTYESSLVLNVGTTGDRIIRQTFEYFRYQPGKSQLVLLTGILGDNSGIKSTIGYFDCNNGVFFRNNDGVIEVGIRSNTNNGIVEERVVTQANWDNPNLDVDFTKAQIFIIDFEWLGVGRVRFGLDLGERIEYIHTIQNANIFNKVYMATANLPCRYELESLGSAGNSKQICTSVITEGGYEQRGFVRSIDNGSTAVNVSGTEGVVLSIKLKSSFARAAILLENLSLMQTSNNSIVYYKVIARHDLVGASWQDVDTNSIAQYDISATGYTGGYVIDSGYIASRVQGILNVDYTMIPPIKSFFDGSSMIVSVVASTIDGGSAPCFSNIRFRELY